MLKAAGLLILYLVIELRKYGCTLQDGHPWNVLFDGISPYYIDIGSIVPLHGNAPCYPLDEFQRFSLTR